MAASFAAAGDVQTTDDRWMAQPQDSDDLAEHPLFAGGGGAAGSGAPAHTASAPAAGGFLGGFAQSRPPQPSAVHDEDDDVPVAGGLNGASGSSMAALPPSQAYTEAASSEAFSQESAGAQHPARLQTDEFLGFWSHSVPRAGAAPGAPAASANPQSTPQAQRTFASAAFMAEESPSALVDGIVRAGLDTPSRPHGGHHAHPAQGQDAASPYSGAASAFSGGSAVPTEKESPDSTLASVSPDGTRRPTQYRTVQQHFEVQQGGGQHHRGGGPAAAGGYAGGRGGTASSRPMGPLRSAGDSACIVVLEFKMERRRRFRCPLELESRVVPDQWVVVQLDGGGVDMGSCVEVYRAHDRLTIPKHYGHGECGVVLRLANDEDCKVINEVIPEKEEVALAKAHQLVHFLHMPFTCIDAEFQFDLKAVNLYYTLTPQAFTSVIPNVSRLQRELGFKLKAKVHLEQLVPVE